MFEDRRDAGRKLAIRLAAHRLRDPVVVGLPRGGVVVADAVADALGAPLDVLVARKLRAPGQPEVGIGALVLGAHPDVVLDEEAIALMGVPADYVCAEIERQLAEARLREALFREGCGAVPLRGRTVVVVDDGIATGGTMRAAVRSIRRAEPDRVVLAAPVASPEAVEVLEPLGDAAVWLRVPRRFVAVGASYRDFEEVSDGEVMALLAAARRRGSRPPSPDPGAPQRPY